MKQSINFGRQSWRPVKPSDLEIINRIADSIHTGLPERPEVFAEKAELFPQGCMLLTDDGTPVG
jgi:hypothetical protein